MAKLRVKRNNEQDIHPKGWGAEVWVENRPEYCGKLLLFNAGHGTSMHFHANKVETMYLQSGNLRVDLIDPENGQRYSEILKPGDSIFIPRNQPHQLVANEACELFEFSSMHEDSDSYRIWKGN